MRRTKIALVRGWYLNKGELAHYDFLADEFDIVAYASTCPLFPQEGIKLPIRRFPWVGAAAFLLGRRYGSYLNRGLYKYVRFSQWMWGLEQALRDVKIIHAADTHHLFSWQAARAKRKYGKKLVLTVWENIPFQDERRAVYRFLRKRIVQETDLFLPVTERGREMLLLQGIPSSRIEVLPPAVDLDRFKPGPKSAEDRSIFGFREDDIVILFVGRFHRTKGLSYLLYAAKRLEMDEDIASLPYKFLLIGSGEEHDRIRRLTDALDLVRRVRIMDRVPHDELPRLYNIGDMLVVPSVPTEEWQEQFGLVLLEAMASGKPVISTFSGSIPDVAGDAVLLVPPSDFLSLSQAIKTLILQPARRRDYAEKARRRVEELFDPHRIAARLAAIYRDLART